MHAGVLRLPRLLRTAPDLGSDAELLRRFTATRDEPAFAELVRRHGPLVLAVCRRVVSDSHLADDAFQATFVVLARKAASAGVGCRLSTWLHSVAVKVSLRARTMVGRRAKRETLTAAVPERGAVPPPADDTAAVLDEEIDRLPESLRAAVVLCELRGVGRRDAAKELGIAEGTLSSRLAAARKKLAERLRARGLAPVALLPAVFLPTDLATAAVAVSTGKVELSSQLTQLVDGGMKMALLTKLKLAVVAVAAVAVLSAGGFGVGGRWGNESAAAPVPKDAADPGVIWVFRPAEGELVGYAPDGKKVRAVKVREGKVDPKHFLGITRDGQHALLLAKTGVVFHDEDTDPQGTPILTIHLLPLHEAGKLTDTGIACQSWSRYVTGRDGKTLVVEHDRSPRDEKGVPEHPIKYETVAYDLTTFKGTKRPALGKGFWLAEELTNGDRILAFGQHDTEKRPLQSFHLLPAGSDKPVSLTGEDETDFLDPSPDGKTLLVTRQFSHKTKPGDSFHKMFILDRATGKAEPFAHRESTMHASGHWSPDGTRVAYEWMERGVAPPVKNLGGLQPLPVARGQVVVSDTNGKSEKVVLEYEGYAGGSHDAAQLWHEARPRLVGWYPGRRNAPVPKPPAAWKEAPPITFDTGKVTGVAVSPSGKTLAVARDNGLIDFYDPATRQHITTMDVAGEKGSAAGTVTAVAFCPVPHPKNGDIFAVTHKHGVKFGTVGLGIFTDDAAKVDGIPVNWTVQDFDPHQLKWLGDKSLVATNGAKLGWRYRLDGKPDKLDFDWELPNGKRHGPTVLEAIPGHDDYFLTNGSLFEEKNEIEIAVAPPASSPQARLPGHNSRPTAAVASKDGKRIVTADAGGTLIVWDGEKLAFKEKARMSVGPGLAQLALAPDGKTVAVLRVHGVSWLGELPNRSSEVFELFVFDITSPPAKPTPIWSNETRSLPGKRSGPASLAFGPDGKTLLAAFADPFTTDKQFYGDIPKSVGVKVWTLSEPDERKKNAPVPKAAADPGVVWAYNWQSGKLLAYRPDGEKVKEWKLPYGNWFKGVTPDGTRLVYGAEQGNKLPKVILDDRPTLRLHARPIDDEEKFTDLGVPVAYVERFLWSADGKRFVRARQAAKADEVAVAVHDANGKELKALTLGSDQTVFGFTPDGSGLVVGDSATDSSKGDTKLSALDWSTGKSAPLFAGVYFDHPVLSPDGKRLLGFDNLAPFFEQDKPGKSVLVHDVAAKKTAAVAKRDKQSSADGLWSPDGTRIAYRWQDSVAKPLGGGAFAVVGDWHFVTCGADGKSEAALFTDIDTTQLIAWTPTPPALRKNAPLPKAKLDGKLAVWQGGAVAVLSPNGTELARHAREEFGEEFGSAFVRLSPDGSRVALAWCDAHNRNNGHAAILAADGKKVEHAKGFIGAPWAAHWLPSDDANDPQFGINGSLKLHFLSLKSGEMMDAIGNGYNATLAAAPNGVQVQQHDPVKKTLRIGTPEADDNDCFFVAEKDLGGTVTGVSRDGRTLLVVGAKGVVLHDAKTGDRVTVAEHAGWCNAALASNGEAVVIATRHEAKKPIDAPTYNLSVYDRATKETTVLVRESKTPIRAVDFWSPSKADDRKKNAPVPAARDAGLLWVKDVKANQLTAYTPALEVAKRVKLPAGETFLGLTPDGGSMVYAANAGKVDGPTYHLRPVGEDTTGTDLGLEHIVWDFPPIWSPDGKQFLRVRKDIKRKMPGFLGTIFRYDVFDLATKKATHLPDVPYDHWIMDWTADGKKFVAQSLRKGEEDTLHLMDPDGTSKPLPAEGKAVPPYKLTRSADGKTFLFSSWDSLWAIDAATGKRKELLDKTHGFPKPAWSPDGKRMAVAYCKYTTKLRGDWDVQRLAVSDADGTNRKEITLRDKAKGEEAYDVDFLGWYPNKPAPPVLPKKNAPVPKENTMGLTATVTFDKKEILLGEPIYFAFAVNNPTEKAWQFEEGGDYRNRLGRPNSFTVIVTGPDGKAVPQPDSGFDLGGISVMKKLPADGKAAFQPLFLPHWATFEKPGEYTITVRRKVGLVPAEVEDGFRAKAAPVNLSATAKLTVLPADAKKMGELIETLGKAMLDRKTDGYEKATKMLLAIRDVRAVPHFIELGKLPHPSYRYSACEGLGHFKTDEAFAALKALYATTGLELRESATTQELADSSANGVRHAAMGAIVNCGHPDALPFAWKMGLADGYYGVRLTVLHKAYDVKSAEARKVIAALREDVHESVRNEAKRYTELLAKEK